jgi:hypothetical protein
MKHPEMGAQFNLLGLDGGVHRRPFAEAHEASANI